MVEIIVNGETQRIAQNATVAQLLERLFSSAPQQGIAVAVNDEVVPRVRWVAHTLNAGDTLEVLQATQGG